MKKIIAVLGGAFSPVTIGHLSLAEEVTNEYDVEKVLFMPVSDKYEKKGLIPAVHRINMLKEVCMKNNKFEVCQIETDSEKLLYTIESLTFIKEKHPNNQIAFIMGSDNLKQIHKWKEFDKLMSSFIFIVISRDGESTREIVEESNELKKYSERFLHFDHKIRNDASSTYIRELLKNKKSIRYLVADEVYDYINNHNLDWENTSEG